MAPPTMRRPRAREGEVSPAGKLLLVFVVAATIVYVAFGGGGSREPIDRATATAAAAATARGEARLADASLAKNLGTRETQLELRWGVDRDIATRICAKNRAFAEPSGYWVSGTTFLDDEATTFQHAVTFHDSATGLPLFVAPRGRTWREFEAESRAHGWPSFRDEEVVWENVRVLGRENNAEVISADGVTHLGHNLPDAIGNRYCVNIACVAGRASEEDMLARERELKEAHRARTEREKKRTTATTATGDEDAFR